MVAKLEIPFTKMHGLGNDFVVINNLGRNICLTKQQIRQLADRHFGIGCDQLLLVEPPTEKDVDFTYRIFNANGQEVEQCGNGARCFAHFVRDHHLLDRDEIRVMTKAGKMTLYLQPKGLVRVNMGIPRLLEKEKVFPEVGRDYLFDLVEVGNPHLVLRVGDISRSPIETIGQQFADCSIFPRGVNVGFMQVVDRQNIKLRVYERGVGETLACGSGACAALVVAYSKQWVDSEATVRLPGGCLLVSWDGPRQPIWLSGPATRVYEGKFYLP